MRPTCCRLYCSIFLTIGLAVVLLAGCQGARGNGSDAKENQLLQIASEYGTDQNLDKALAALDRLGVPNVRQFVALVTERYIRVGQDGLVTDSLVHLSRDLGIITNLIARYGEMEETPSETAAETPSSATLATLSEPTATATFLAAASPTFMPTATPLPLPTDTPLPPTVTPTPTWAAPRVRVSSPVNLRAGPGTVHPIVGVMRSGDELPIVARNLAGTWWKVCCVDEQLVWVSATVVEEVGDTSLVSPAASIPTPPPQPTPTPAPPTPTPKPAIDFRIVEQRMFSNEENGGSFDGESLHCGFGNILYVLVIDAAGNPLDGVVVRGIYTGDMPVTGAKGPGRTELSFGAGGGDELVVDRDASGRQYSSEKTRPLVARDRDIPVSDFIAGRYCRDEADCQQKVNNNQLCQPHYSYSVIFQRTW